MPSFIPNTDAVLATYAATLARSEAMGTAANSQRNNPTLRGGGSLSDVSVDPGLELRRDNGAARSGHSPPFSD